MNFNSLEIAIFKNMVCHYIDKNKNSFIQFEEILITINRNKLFKEILNRFLEKFNELEAVIISDFEGLILAGEKQKGFESNLEIVSVLTTLISPVLDRIRNEFAFRNFGTASFDTEEYRLLFISIDEKRTLSLILNSMSSIERIAPYGLFLAEKTAQILNAKEDDIVQIAIPDFESEIDRHQTLKQSLIQSQLEEKGNYSFKFVVVGDHEVGKTSIIRRFVERKFSADYRATIGLNILAHNFLLEGNEISLTLWDLGAQEFFKRYRKIYYTGAEAAFIVYDLVNQQSFDNVRNWYNELTEFILDKDIPIVIVANKLDLVDKRVISREDGMSLVKNLSDGVSYIETSALSGENVQDAFKLIAYHYILRSKQKAKKAIKEDLFEAIKSTLKDLVILELTFIYENLSWNPGFQVILDLDKLGEYSKIKDNPTEKLYAYKNGLILNSATYDNFNLANSDGAFCVFDAREKEHIDPEWKNILVKIIQKIRKKRAIIIGLRVSEGVNWSQLMEEFDIEQDLEEKLVSVLFLKIGPDYRDKIYEHLKVMLNAIASTRSLK
ncbi:MAG: Rab family GTPase [Candidatus Heimdallarchaeota archaeon]